MTREEAREEILAAIAFYDERGKDWTDVVTFIGIMACFGSWDELVDSIRPPYRRRLPEDSEKLT